MDNLYATPTSNIAGAGNTSGTITPKMLDDMQRTKPWVLLIGIMFFISAAITLIAAVGLMIAGSHLPVGMPAVMPAGMIAVMGIVYLVMSIIQFTLGIFLMKYSGGIRRLLISRHSSDLEAALAAQRVFWVTSGILTLIGLVIMIIVIVGGIVAAANRGF